MATEFPLPGKVALVTGAARGIGFETARVLHARGASVAIVDLDRQATEDACRAIGERTLAIAADVTDAEAMKAAVSTIVEHFGGLDVVVANAGVAPTQGPMVTVNPQEWERVLEIDLLGVWRTVHPTLEHIIARRGHVVVVASVYAFMNGLMASPYAAAKAGVEQIGRALRAELSIHGASASVAYFGFIDTDMVRDAFAQPGAQKAEEMFPAFVTKRLKPSVAGTAIVDGIQARAQMIIRPRWWRIYSVLRGILNPLLDRQAGRDQRIQDSIRLNEQLRREEAAVRETADSD
jgi:NAD(P)-dependent dehydrogenase (short-subunit alcohol dehydrogenase family)